MKKLMLSLIAALSVLSSVKAISWGDYLQNKATTYGQYFATNNVVFSSLGLTGDNWLARIALGTGVCLFSGCGTRIITKKAKFFKSTSTNNRRIISLSVGLGMGGLSMFIAEKLKLT